MAFKKFEQNDIIKNTMRTYPHCEFLIFDSNVYYNQRPNQSGVRNNRVRNVPNGFISLYESNIDRPEVSTGRYIGVAKELPIGGPPDTRIPDNGRIYPWISKDSAGASFKTVGKRSYKNEFEYGEILRSKYPLSASLTREFIADVSSSLDKDGYRTGAGLYSKSWFSLKNTLEYYRVRNSSYTMFSGITNINIIHIPSIFYGNKIKPGTVNLEWYYEGDYLGSLVDNKENGQLIQVLGTYNYGPRPTGPSPRAPEDGRVAGVVLYEEGAIILSGSWDLASDNMAFGDGITDKPQWRYWGAGANDGNSRDTTDSTFGKGSYKLSFRGQTDTQVLTMFAKAKKGEVNYSNNPTFLQYGQDKIFKSSSAIYHENSDLKLVNFVSSSYTGYNAPFKRQVYISRIGIYDKYKNLIGIASLASPVLKKDDDDYTFKLKIDI